MTSGDFMSLIGDNYDDIVALFKSRLHKMNYKFDEDAFSDSFIKCAYKFGYDQITYDTAIKYFWVAYLNSIRSSFTAMAKLDFISLEESPDIIEENIDSNDIYNTIMDAITVVYNEEDMNIYRLYKYHNWSKQELESAGFDCSNLSEKIKDIHKFVKQYSKSL